MPARARISSLGAERVAHFILVIRHQRVLLDADLAALYRVETRVLLQAVRRNLERFPPDFMFVLTQHEAKSLRSQIVTSSWGGPASSASFGYSEPTITRSARI